MSKKSLHPRVLKVATQPVIAGTLLLLVGVTVELVIAANEPSTSMLPVIARILAYLAIVSWTAVVQLEVLRDNLRSTERRIEKRIAGAESQIGEAITTGLITSLQSPDALYRTLCEARDRSTLIRLMKVRRDPPINMDRGQSLDHEALGPHASEWYDELAEWAKTEGNRLERIFAVGDAISGTMSEELGSYASTIDQQMRDKGVDAASWDQIQILWPLDYPALNVCIFDDREIILTIGSASARKFPVNGLHVTHKATVQLFSSHYYEPVKNLRYDESS